MPDRHCEIAGSEFPFSRGVSFYEVNEDGLIVAGRDLVESATKPGSAALQVSHCPGVDLLIHAKHTRDESAAAGT